MTVLSGLRLITPKYNKASNWLIVLLGLIFIITSIKKNAKDNFERLEQSKSDSLKDKKIDSLQNGINKMLKNQKEFEAYLKEKPFGISRDSVTNKPTYIQFNDNHVNNTIIGKADNVDIH
jgi:hypothetical protein